MENAFGLPQPMIIKIMKKNILLLLLIVISSGVFGQGFPIQITNQLNPRESRFGLPWGPAGGDGGIVKYGITGATITPNTLINANKTTVIPA